LETFHYNGREISVNLTYKGKQPLQIDTARN